MLETAGVGQVRTRVVTVTVTGVVTVGPLHKLAASRLQVNQVHTLTEEVAPEHISAQGWGRPWSDCPPVVEIRRAGVEVVSDPLSGRAHHPLHHHLHVGVDGPHLQEPGQHLAVGDQANQLIPECLQAPGISVCLGERRRVLAPA